MAALNTGEGALAGFLAALVISCLCAFLLSLSPWARAGLSPYLMILQLTPVVVISPVLVIWIGAGFKSVAVITFLICVFPLIVNTTQGLLSVDRRFLDLFQMAHASRTQVLLQLRIPSALPFFFAGLRIAATLAPIGAVVGDFTAGDSAGAGLGFLTIIYSANFRYPELFATVVANCMLGFLFTGSVVLASRLVLSRWHSSDATSSPEH
jgi:NitT/TauT family transport system permease protein